MELLHLLENTFPQWNYMTLPERKSALADILPSIRDRIYKIGSSRPLPGARLFVPQVLLDIQISDQDVFTKVRCRFGFSTLRTRQSLRVGFPIDERNPLLESRGGALHCLETLGVYFV